ncbi:ATP-dependent Clp protease ATP-binding subunit [Patescibacteria group bacterium]|nr:ATP-dependent Clp protease ATP-binding subunit [Patescibacteria group bacterium]
MVAERKKLQFTDCKECLVSPNSICKYCQGDEFLGKVGGSILYWGLSKNINFIKSPEYIQFKKMARVGLFYLNLIFLLLVLILLIVIDVEQEKSILTSLLVESTPLALFFWILLGLFLITSFNHFYHKPKIAPVNNFGSEPVSENMFNKIDIAKSFNQELENAVNNSVLKAHRSKFSPSVWHLFDELLNHNEFLWLLLKMEVDPHLIKDITSQKIKSAGVDDKYSSFPPEYDEILMIAYIEASRLKADDVSYNHMLLAMVIVAKDVMEMFAGLNQTLDDVTKVCIWQEILDQQNRRIEAYRQKSKFKPVGHMNRAWTAVPTPILDTYGRDLTMMAKYESLERLVDRESELAQAMNVLEKTSKNNVLFIGESGVGKSTLVNGIAYKMAAEEVPDLLKDKRLVTLNCSQLFSSGGVGGEKLFVSALQEVLKSKNIILYIDDLHLLAGVKTISGGPMDALSILADTLSKNRIQFVASTSPEGYSKYISTYDSLITDLTTIEVPEVDHETAIQIIESATHKIENANKVLISYPAVKSSVELSDDLIVQKKLPTKAYDLLQEAAIVVKNKKKLIVTKKDITELMQQKTRVPLSRVTEEESQTLLNLEDELHKRIIGQNTAVKQVAEAIKRARVGLKDKNKPIASFLFVGPTGVGKTELAKSLAAIYFGDEERMIRMDMSEYQEVGDIKKIIGAPPGSSEFEERGYMTEAVKKEPFSLILLDELEKAHKDILNLFLQVLDEGKVKDSMGRMVKFNNSIIIATSNAGTSLIQAGMKANKNIERIEQELMEELKKFYRPEFLNRFDGVIMFKPLEHEEVVKIAALMIAKINKNMAEQKIGVEVEEKALDNFIKEGYNQEFGARALYRTLQEKVKNVIADKMLKGELKAGKKLIIKDEKEAEVVDI